MAFSKLSSTTKNVKLQRRFLSIIRLSHHALILHFYPQSCSNICFTLSALLSPTTRTVRLAHRSLYTSSDHQTLCLDNSSQMGPVRERERHTHPAVVVFFTSFSLFGFEFVFVIFIKVHCVLYLGGLCRSGTEQDVSPDSPGR